jgi:hypothetical protein
MMAWWRGYRRRACFGYLRSGELGSVGEGGAGALIWGPYSVSTRAVSATASLIPEER